MKRLVVHAVIYASSLSALIARADGPSPASGPATPLAQALSGAAKDAFNSALRAIDDRDFEDAYIKFEHAYQLSRDPRVLFNMALCERHLQNYASMRKLLERYRHEAGSAMSADERENVKAALAAIQVLVGTLKVSVNEDAADVAVDGESVGTTPITEPIVVNPGKHTISVHKKGFGPIERVLEVTANSETPLTLTLAPEASPARLVVASDDAASVAIDGRAVAVANFQGPLTPGVHQVRVTERGKVPYVVQVLLRPGETRTLQVTLDDEKSSGAIWPWLVGGAAVAAAAAVGGYFLLQPTDQPAPIQGKWGTVQFGAVVKR